MKITRIGSGTSTSMGLWTPSKSGLISWTFDPAPSAGSSSTATAGVLQVVSLDIPAPTTITNIVMYVVTAGATLTANQCYAVLYDSSGNKLSQTADQSSNWNSTGTKTMALADAQSVQAGTVKVGFYSNGTTQPSFARALNSTATALVNIGLSTPNFRFATANTGLTTTPPSTIGAQTVSGVSWFVAVS